MIAAAHNRLGLQEVSRGVGLHAMYRRRCARRLEPDNQTEGPVRALLGSKLSYGWRKNAIFN
jgi:hypothetical protein